MLTMRHHIFIIIILVLLIILFIYWGYSAKYDKTEYNPTIGMIIDRKLEKRDKVVLKKIVNGINVYSKVIVYIADIKFKYFVDGDWYESYYQYSNIDPNYTNNKFIKEWKQSTNGSLIDIYYDINNPSKSYKKLSDALFKNSMYYYFLSCITVIILCTYVFYLYRQQ